MKEESRTECEMSAKIERRKGWEEGKSVSGRCSYIHVQAQFSLRVFSASPVARPIFC